MGRSYWFECSKCGYRAKVSGRSDRGLTFCVQTVVCRDCRELFDAVTAVRRGAQLRNHSLAPNNGARLLEAGPAPNGKRPPSFLTALNRLSFTGACQFEWVRFPLQCPVSPRHRIQSWTEPDKCPRCGSYLEKGALPYRIWD